MKYNFSIEDWNIACDFLEDDPVNNGLDFINLTRKWKSEIVININDILVNNNLSKNIIKSFQASYNIFISFFIESSNNFINIIERNFLQKKIDNKYLLDTELIIYINKLMNKLNSINLNFSIKTIYSNEFNQDLKNKINNFNDYIYNIILKYIDTLQRMWIRAIPFLVNKTY